MQKIPPMRLILILRFLLKKLLKMNLIMQWKIDMATKGFRYTIEWYTPYSDPPDELPRIKAEMFETVEQRSERQRRGEPSVPTSFSSLHVIGDHYCITIQAINPPPIMLNKTALASVRKKRAERRINKKYPLFADQFLSAEMNTKPDYYAGETREDLLAAHERIIANELDLYNRFLQEIN